RIARSAGDQPVELGIESAAAARAQAGLRARFEALAEQLQLVVRHTDGGQSRGLPLEQQPRFRKLRERHATETEQRRQIAHDRRGVDFADEVAAGGALTDLDETAVLERAQRFAHGHAARAELAHKLPLRGQLVTTREASLVNRPLDLRDDMLVYARCPYRSEHRCASLSDQRAPMSRAPAGRAPAQTRSARARKNNSVPGYTSPTSPQ